MQGNPLRHRVQIREKFAGLGSAVLRDYRSNSVDQFFNKGPCGFLQRLEAFCESLAIEHFQTKTIKKPESSYTRVTRLPNKQKNRSILTYMKHCRGPARGVVFMAGTLAAFLTISARGTAGEPGQAIGSASAEPGVEMPDFS